MITHTKKVSFNSVNALCLEVQPCPLWAAVYILVFTKATDIHFRELWLAPLTRDIQVC